jgi:tetratricopeptide (TPR) repeat protein
MKNIFLLLLFLVLASCNTTSVQVEEVLQQANSYMETHPDSALLILQKIPQPATLRGKVQADYALLYTQACDKNYLPADNDSLIQIAVTYYKEKKESIETAKSYFYLGCVYRDMGNAVQATESLLKALGAIPNSYQKERITMLIHYNLAIQYNDEGLHQDALYHYQKALCNAQEREDIKDISYCSGDIGTTFLYLNQNDSALTYYQHALERGYLLNDTILIRNGFRNLALYYNTIENYELTNKYIINLMKMGETNLHSIYNLKANALLQLGEKDSANYYLQKAVLSTNLATRTMAYYHLYELEKLNTPSKLTNYVDSFLLYRDSLTILSKQEAMHKLSTQYLMQLHTQQLDAQREKERIYIISICVVVLLISGGIWARIERNRKLYFAEMKRKLAESHLDTIKQYIKNEIGEETQLDIKIREIEQEKINSCIKTFHQSTWHKRLTNLSPQSESFLSNKEQNALYIDLHSIFADFIDILRNKYPSIKDADIYFCLLSLCGYSLKAIACYLRTNDRNLSTRKSRLKKVLEKNDFEFIFYSAL